MRITTVIAALMLSGCAAPLPPGLDGAARNYPPLITGFNVLPTDGSGPYARACPAPLGRVEQKGGPTILFDGASPTDPALCRMRVGGQPVEAWYGIWLTAWPGADKARPALKRIIEGRTGAVEGFDVQIQPGAQYHDLIRNEGIEDINLLGTTYHALKISHYREGFDGNTYRSVATVWKDIPTGLLIYATYHHISGKPELDDPLIPTAIIAGR